MVEVKFEGRELCCLDMVLEEVGSSEQTQEIKLTDGMPDVGQVIAAWGQPILRGKEWRSDSISFTGGMMVWVLYRPEDGSGEKCIDTWIPFQMKWDLPAGAGEGDIRLRCLCRFVDARSVSPRKIMVRSGMAVMVNAFARQEKTVFEPRLQEAGLELLKVTYPVRLNREAGEKTFLLDENLTLPESMPQPEKLLYYRMEPKVTDKKVLTGKMVFRGSGILHAVYADQAGKVSAWDFEVPFSQYTDLQGEYSTDARGEIWPAVTSLELEWDKEEGFRVKCGLAAQYLITDQILLETIEDAYAPGRELELNSRILELPVVLENRRELVSAEHTLITEGGSAADGIFLPDFPRQMRTETGIAMELPGTFQALYYDDEGLLRSGSSKWEGSLTLPSDECADLTALPGVGQVQMTPVGKGIQMKLELPMEVTARADQGFPMVTGVALGEQSKPDPARPSLILRRAGSKGLWDIAKDAGSTVEAIRQANGIQGEPVPGQMLLIPVP